MVTEKEVIDAVRSFPNGSAGGMDGLSPQHLKNLLMGPQDEHKKKLLNSLAQFINHVLAGKVPESYRTVFFGAALIALRKKDGGLRPIAVGNTLRRLACKIVSKRVMPSIRAKLKPHQLGYGIKGGAEAAVHATRGFLAENTDAILVKLDFKNAFNSFRRDNLLQVAVKDLPEYARFIWSAYRRPSGLICGEAILSSESGVHQGDPLGPLLFCLCVDHIVKGCANRAAAICVNRP